MATKPEFASEANYQNGLAAAVLFAVFAAVFVTSTFPDPVGFPQDASIVAGIGYALFDLTTMSPVETEGFLAAFEIVDVVLVAALVAAVMLARRETEGLGGMLTALTDGGSAKHRAGEEGGETSEAADGGDH
jgi:NADH-quinone oxidoreductase subunit J